MCNLFIAVYTVFSTICTELTLDPFETESIMFAQKNCIYNNSTSFWIAGLLLSHQNIENNLELDEYTHVTG